MQRHPNHLIRRYKNGSIDHNHYLAQGRLARSRQATRMLGTVRPSHRGTATVFIVPVLALATAFCWMYVSRLL